ncbi:MAG: 8-amino-7-oxononanoate synthase [Bacteroidota bacterium]
MPSSPDHIGAMLRKLVAADQLRRLSSPPPGSVDFSSKDYLGLAKAEFNGQGPEGATGSRLLNGNHPTHEAFETFAADFFKAPTALLFSSGYLANVGLLSAIARRGDTFLYDAQIHASMRDGMRLSPAQRFAFRHNDLADLERLLKKATGTCFVVAEALYSMDGDCPDLEAMADLTDKYGAWLIVDEAHSTGLFGEYGEGWAVESGVADRIWARIYTFGKAVGRQGAVVTGPPELKDYLVNRARTFIYTTAMAPRQVAGLAPALEAVANAGAEREQLRALHRRFYAEMKKGGLEVLEAFTPICPVVVPGNAAVMRLAEAVQAAGYDVRAIRYPSVEKGTERLRIILHSFNEMAEIDGLVETIYREFG